MQRPGMPVPFMFQEFATSLGPANVPAQPQPAAVAPPSAVLARAVTAAGARSIVEELVSAVVGPGVGTETRSFVALFLY